MALFSSRLSLSPLREGAGEGKEERERIPQQLFTRTLASAQSLNYQPVEMTTALK